MTVSNNYKKIASKKVIDRDSNFIKEWLIPENELPKSQDVLKFPIKSGFLSKEEIEITESSVPEILLKIKSKEWKSLQVTKAFCHRASISHQLVNCLSEVFFNEAFKQAKELDDYYEKTGKLKGSFHGLPVSLKDNLNVKGQATTIGFVGFSFEPKGGATYDSALVELLRDQGAVFYVKTNVPVAMMMAESVNHVYGKTSTPFNTDLSSGGSSGGEAALLALKGACIGIGSDIGGSIRIPASFNNLFAIRPTFGRFPTYGTRSGLPGLESVNSVNGPLSTSLESIEFYCENVIGAKPWNYDPKVYEVPWKQDVQLPEKLTFAVLYDDGYVKPTPPIQRGLKEAIAKLKAAGHEIIEWEATDHQRLANIITAFFLADGGIHCKEYTALTGEPFFPDMKMYETAKEMGVSKLWDLQAERTLLCKKYLERWLETSSKTSTGNPIDGIILPASPFAGCPHGKYQYVGYTSPFNALDYSCGILPVTRADKNIDLKEEGYKPRNDVDEYIYGNYNPEEINGGAVAIQLVAGRLKEEKLLAMMKVLSKIIDY